MNTDQSEIEKIADFLRQKALRRSAVRYSAIYEFFPDGTSDTTVWNAFEDACRSLAEPKEAIYGALMAKKDNDLPSTGFFDIFRNARRDEYLKVTNGKNVEACELTKAQMQAIAGFERIRVHNHAVNT